MRHRKLPGPLRAWQNRRKVARLRARNETALKVLASTDQMLARQRDRRNP